MNVIKLMVVALAGWINQQQEDVIDDATAASGLADCFATTTGMPRETDDFNFWTQRDRGQEFPLGISERDVWVLKTFAR
ncbi:MAG: hypothetical protein VCA73_15785 [Roseibacillus sp.]|jgi:hypothetical protein